VRVGVAYQKKLLPLKAEPGMGIDNKYVIDSIDIVP
jgi:hypothetical protein